MSARPPILVIDDDDDVRQTLCDNLSAAGFSVEQAPHGLAGLSSLHQLDRYGRLPRVVITDILMPEKEGLEIIMEINRDFPDLKVIAISGSSNPTLNFLDIAEKLGADAVLPKPVDMNRLIDTVRRLSA